MSKSSVVSHHITARASAGRSERLGTVLSGFVASASVAPGCLHFALQRSMTDGDLWVLNGTWVDEQAMNAWYCSPDLTVFSELVASRLVSSVDFQTFVSVSVSEAQAAFGAPFEKKAG